MKKIDKIPNPTASKAFLEAVLENLSDGVVACNANGTLTTFNRATREFHDLPQRPIPADQWASHYNLFHADGKTPMDTEDIPLYRALAGEKVRDVELVIATKDRQRCVLCNGQPILDIDGNTLGAVVTMHDITEIKKASQEIQSFNLQLEQRVQDRTAELQKTNQELSREIREREKAEAELAKSEKRFRTLFEQSPLSVQLLSVNGRTLEVNSAWKKLWGLSDDFILKDYNLLEDPQLVEKGIMGVIRKGFAGEGGKIPPIFYDSAVHESNGRGRWVEAYIEPIFNEEGQVKEVVLIHNDVSDQVLLEQDLRAAQIAAEEASRLKSAFLANMSHEIRTPLSAILGFTELLKDPNITPENTDEYLQVIDRSGKSLTKIIDDILDLSKVEAGRLKIESFPVDVGQLIDGVLALFKIQVLQRDLTLEAINEIDESTPVNTDPARLRQILINLVGNALKFTPAGEIQIKAATLLRDNESMIKISVQDTGIGIPKDQEAGLFKTFSQLDSTQTRQHGGTGLGLALSRRLAQAMGGNVYLEESTPGKGSLFAVELPLAKTSSTTVTPTEEKPPLTAEFSGLRILVVDDSGDNRKLLNRMLSKKGGSVAEASNGAQAVSRALNEEFDIVLMDIQMPVMDGLEAIEDLRRRNYAGPIIALTAHAMPEDRERCLTAGANAHLSKPIAFNELDRLIAEFSFHQNS